jgi:hypothetical protein
MASSSPVGSVEAEHPDIILAQKCPDSSIRFVRCALLTLPPGLILGDAP